MKAIYERTSRPVRNLLHTFVLVLLGSPHFKNPNLAAAGANLKDYILRIFFSFNKVTHSNGWFYFTIYLTLYSVSQNRGLRSAKFH